MTPLEREDLAGLGCVVALLLFAVGLALFQAARGAW